MSTILDLSDIAQRSGQPRTVWRDELLPATFRAQQFHCESNSMDGGRHIVTHEFPKRDIPYSEDMGRRAKEFSIRGYFIAYPFNSSQNLYQRDYRQPRNSLLSVLDDGQPGVLQLPSLPALYVRCTKYRLTEEEKFGGYCTIDMSFVEYGYQPGVTGPDTAALLAAASQTLKARVQAVLAQGPQSAAPTPPPPTTLPPPQRQRMWLGPPKRIGRQGDDTRQVDIPHSAVAPPAVQPTPYVPPLPEYRDPPVFPPFIP